MSISPLRVTFDSNAWQMAVVPSLARKSDLYADYVTIHDALRGKQIQGFISETVGTLEAIRNLGRKAYFTSIRPNVNVQVVNVTRGQALLKIDMGTTHDRWQLPENRPAARPRAVAEAATLVATRPACHVFRQQRTNGEVA
jgi:hypothetical protein